MRLSEFLNRAFRIILLILVGYGFYLFFSKSPTKNRHEVQGWDELLSCWSVENLDGTKHLMFSSDGSAVFSISQPPSAEKTETLRGTWSLSAGKKSRYSVEIAELHEDYVLVMSPVGEGCMLVSGSLQSANLQKSWFSVLEDASEYREPPGSF
jgi:hypothetical protein